MISNISDHFPCLTGIPDTKLPNTNIAFTYHLYPENCFSSISEEIEAQDWQETASHSLDMAFTRFINTLQASFNHHCPLKSVNIPANKAIREKWMTPSLMNKSKSLHALFRRVCREDRKSALFQNYVTQRNEFNKEKRRCKQSYYATLLTTYRNDSKKIWQIINDQQGKSHTHSVIPSQLVYKNGLLKNDKEIADGFNDFFSTIGPLTASTIPPTDRSYTSYLRSLPRCADTLFIDPVTREEVIQIITDLKNSNSSGLDKLPTKLVKNTKTALSNPLMILINKSFVEGKFPSILKSSAITPIFKKGDKEQMTNYRPIALLSTISKIVEKAFNKRLRAFLSERQLFCPHQYGFRRDHSTIDAVSQLVGDVCLGFDRNLPTVAVMLDVSKAFDALDHQILLYKLEYIGVRGLGLSWVRDYLRNRAQRVTINQSFSNFQVTNCGVPQGSILGPLLFSIYMNDLHASITHSKVIQYADDTSIYLTGNRSEIIRLLNYDIEQLRNWFCANKLLLSASKTTAIEFSKPTFIGLDDSRLKIDDAEIVLELSVKLLGIFLDSELNWSTHIDYVHSKLSSALYGLNRCKNLLTSFALKQMYYGLMHPHLQYGISLWGNAYKYRTNKLQISQNKALRCIFHKSATTNADPLFKRSGILKFNDIAKVELIKISYRFTNNKLPANLAAFFTSNETIHQHATRNASQPHVNRYNFQTFRSNFIFLSVNYWNEIPVRVRLGADWGPLVSWCRRRFLSEYAE